MITKETLEDFFQRTRELRDTGKATFDIDDVCKWSFFFVDASREKLAAVGLRLESLDYEVRGFIEPGPEDDDQDTIYLRADRVERHTVDTLHERNLALYAIADELGVADYDGMDVGDADGP